MTKNKPWYAPLIEKWGSKLINAIVALIMGVAGVLLVAPGEQDIKKTVHKVERGGNLAAYADAQKIAEEGYKNWVSRQLEYIRKSMDLNTERRLKEEGAQEERARYMNIIDDCDEEIVDGIVYTRDRETNKLFWDEPSGATHEVKYIPKKGYSFKYHRRWIPVTDMLENK